MAGRPRGSTTKPQIRQFVLDKDIREIMAVAIKKAKDGDTVMAKFLLEQIFGRAPQPLTGGGNDDKPIAILNYVFGNNGNTKNNKIKKKNKNLSGRNVGVEDGINNSIIDTLGANR